MVLQYHESYESSAEALFSLQRDDQVLIVPYLFGIQIQSEPFSCKLNSTKGKRVLGAITLCLLQSHKLVNSSMSFAAQATSMIPMGQVIVD